MPQDIKVLVRKKMPRIKDCPVLKKYGSLPTARQSYRNKKKDAIERGIEFQLTFLEYYEWFFNQGIDKNIPQKNDKNAWCMCRKNDIGSYSLDNIYLDTMSNNSTYGNYNMHHVKKIQINYQYGEKHHRYKGNK